MSLKVFDLQCEQGHVFEGWFKTADAFEQQKSRGLISCPVCESREVEKKLTAARINTGAPRSEPAPASQPGKAGSAMLSPAPAHMAHLQAAFLKHLRKIVRETENVGPRFADEARRMHYGEIEERAIRGTATRDEQEALAEDGIAVMPLPDFLDDDRLQ